MTDTVQKRIEEIILILLIAMNLLEVAGLLPGEVEFFKAIISVTGLGYVIYKTSLSDIFFGEKNKTLDVMLLSSYFLMISNKFIQFSIASFEEAELLQEFFLVFNRRANEITFFSLIFGLVLIVMISIMATRHLRIKAPSVMHAIHGEKIHNPFAKFISVFIIFLGFFIIFFNPVMEWFALVIDAPLVVLVLFIYIFRIHNIGKNRNNEEILFKIAESVETFFEKFIELFHSRRTLFFAISGLLIFHLVADVGAFVLPYSFGTSSIYRQNLEDQHDSLHILYEEDKQNFESPVNHLSLFFAYFFNVLGLLYLMLFPCFIWYVIYSVAINHNFQVRHFSNILIALFYGLMVVQLFLPAFSLHAFGYDETSSLYGVDIRTRSVLASGNSVSMFLLVSVGVFLTTFLLSFLPRIKSMLLGFMSIVGVWFFGIYIFNYFMSTLFYYKFQIPLILSLIGGSASTAWIMGAAILLPFYILFLLIESVFYIGGFFNFISHMFKE